MDMPGRHHRVHDKLAAAGQCPNPERVDLACRLRVAAVVTVPLLVLTLSPLPGIAGVRGLFGEHTAMRAELVLAAPVVLWSGWPFVERVWSSFRTWNPDMVSLTGMGVGAAVLHPVVALVAPGVFPAGFRDPPTGTAGVLITNAEALERFEQVGTPIVDKTGTLTAGNPKRVAVKPEAGHDEAEVLRLNTTLDRGSEPADRAGLRGLRDERLIAFGGARHAATTVGAGLRHDEATIGIVAHTPTSEKHA